jgi:hypothetical protein
MLNTSQKKSDNPQNGANLQTVTLLTQILKSGEINLSANNQDLIQLTIKNKEIDLNIVDNKFLKDLLKGNTKSAPILELLKQLKTLAEELKNDGTTITVSYKGETMLTIGSNAKAQFSQLITRTKKVEINNLRKLIQISLS